MYKYIYISFNNRTYKQLDKKMHQAKKNQWFTNRHMECLSFCQSTREQFGSFHVIISVHPDLTRYKIGLVGADLNIPETQSTVCLYLCL